jgi:hypothetical protein
MRFRAESFEAVLKRGRRTTGFNSSNSGTSKLALGERLFEFAHQPRGIFVTLTPNV